MFAVFGAFALAAAIPPTLALSYLSAITPVCERAWTYWCSMLLGSAPFLIAGGLASSIASGLRRRTGGALLASTLCLPICDCAIASYGPTLSRMTPCFAACVVTLGTSCNPAALLVTWFMLGPRVTFARVMCGLAAAIATAGIWRCLPGNPIEPSRAHDACHEEVCEEVFVTRPSHCERFVSASASGMRVFAIAALPASLLIASGLTRRIGHSWLAALALASLLSPCSSSDAIFARALFGRPDCQLAFVIAAQCLDIRQAFFLSRTFGIRRAAGAFAAALGALIVCSLLI